MTTDNLTSPSNSAYAQDVESMPLYVESYPDDLRQEIESAVAALLASDPVPPGEDPDPTFPARPHLLELPELPVQVIGVSGRPHSGKDVFADYMLANYDRVARLNFSDPIISEVNDWLSGYGRRITAANKSNPLHRRLLQLWGRARRLEFEHYWTRRLREAVEQALADNDLVIVAGVRAPSDLQLIQELGGICLRVERPGNPYSADDPIESALDDHLSEMTELLNPAEDDLDPYVASIEALLEELSAPQGSRAGY